MEYGFHDRRGDFVPARPFMRPALYAVAEASKSNFRHIMRGLLEDMWTGRGYQGFSSLDFGRKADFRNNVFWSKDFGQSLSNAPRLSSLKGDEHRQKMSLMNRFHSNAKSKAEGFRFVANNRDYQIGKTPIFYRNYISTGRKLQHYTCFT